MLREREGREMEAHCFHLPPSHCAQKGAILAACMAWAPGASLTVHAELGQW